jgi:hypothetical protein
MTTALCLAGSSWIAAMNASATSCALRAPPDHRLIEELCRIRLKVRDPPCQL